jgi:hypothetical protein
LKLASSIHRQAEEKQLLRGSHRARMPLGHTVLRHEETEVVTPLLQENVLHDTGSIHVSKWWRNGNIPCAGQSAEKVLGKMYVVVVARLDTIGVSHVPGRITDATYVPGRRTGAVNVPVVQAKG